MVYIPTNDDILTADSSSNEVFEVGVVHILANKKIKVIINE